MPKQEILFYASSLPFEYYGVCRNNSFFCIDLHIIIRREKDRRICLFSWSNQLTNKYC